MRVTTTSGFHPPPGVLVEWAAVPSADFAEHPAPPSMNQRFHLESGGSTWLAFSFRDPRVLDLDTLGAAFAAWVRRHETLRSRFRRDGEQVHRDVLPDDGFSLHRTNVGAFTIGEAVREHLVHRFSEQCRPIGWPPHLMAAVLGAEGTTVLGAFDHAHVDAHSLAVAVHEVQVLYRALSAGEPAGLPEVGSFVDRCAAEPCEPAAPADAAVRRWREFLRECGGTTPSFPLYLGVPRGKVARQRSESVPLLGAEAADRVESRCRAGSGSVFTGLLAAFGLALRKSGAAEQVRVLVPLHTRDGPQWTNAVGWFTTNAPVSFAVGGVEQTLRAASRAFRESLRTLETPLPSVLAALPGELRRDRRDVFMLSYVDYRDLPVSVDFPECEPQHISSEGECDDAQFWISRTSEGFFLRTRYPATRRGVAVMERFRAHLDAALADIAG